MKYKVFSWNTYTRDTKYWKQSKPCCHTKEIWLLWVFTLQVLRAWNSFPDKYLNSKQPKVFFPKMFFWGQVVRKGATWESSVFACLGSKTQERHGKLVIIVTTSVIRATRSTCSTSTCHFISMHRSKQPLCPQEGHIKTRPNIQMLLASL